MRVKPLSDKKENQNQFEILQGLNRNILCSIADSNQVFEDYIKSGQIDMRISDYTSWILDQTTLGQGIWIAQNEGAKVYKSNSWGINGSQSNNGSAQYNITSFTQDKLWEQGELNLIDTRDEFDKYLKEN
jgi:hypothetical protein